MASRARARAAGRAASGGRGGAARGAPPADVREPARARRRIDLSETPLRALAARPHLAAALLLALPVLAYLWPALAGGEILSPLAVLYGVPPWSAYVPGDVGGHLNTLLTDVAQSHYPWNWYAREMIHEGTFPAWFPYAFGGVPFYNNPQTVLLSPFSLPIWVLPLHYGIGVSAALKLWAAAFGTYLLARELRLAFLPGLLAGVTYGLCAFNILWLTHESLPGVAALLPWTLWLTERLLRQGGLGPALGLAAATAFALTGGHPGAQIHILLATAAFAAVRAGTLPDRTRAQRLRGLGAAAGAMALGLMLVAVLLLPEALSARGTIGTESREGATGTQPGAQMPFTAIRTTLFPDWWGRPSGLEASIEAQPLGAPEPGGGVFTANFNERTFYAGVVATLLALVALVTPGGWRRKAPFAVLGALALALVLRAPGLHWLATHLPLVEVVQHQRAHFVYELAAAVLAGFGMQAVLTSPRGDRRRWLALGGAALVGLAALAAAAPSGADVSGVLEHFATGADVATDAALALTSVAWYALLAGAVTAALAAAWRWPHRAGWIAGALVVLAAIDMLHFTNGHQPMGPEAKVIPPRTPAIAYLQRHADEGRIVGLGTAVLNDYGALYGLRDVRGYDPPQPTSRFLSLWRMAEPQQRDWQTFSLQSLSPQVVRLASVLGARFIVGEAGIGVPDGPAGRGLTRVYAGRDATVLRNDRAVPRAMVAGAVRVTASEAETRAVLMEDGFDPREAAVVERGEPGAAQLGGGAGTGGRVAGEAEVVEEANSSVTVRAELDRPGLVVLNDNFTDGWRVEVDGREAEAVLANDVMRGVAVPAGTHEVVWRYAVPGLRAGLVLSLLAGGVLVVGCGVLVVRRRRVGER